MSKQQQEAADAMLGAVNKRAMEILDFPVDQREARYAMIQELYFESAVESGAPREQAQEFADKMVEFTRALVKMMEQGGGAAGGNA